MVCSVGCKLQGVCVVCLDLVDLNCTVSTVGTRVDIGAVTHNHAITRAACSFLVHVYIYLTANAINST